MKRPLDSASSADMIATSDNARSWQQWITHFNTSTLLISNIPKSHGKKDIYELFSRYGTIRAVEMVSGGTVALVDFMSILASTDFKKLSINTPFFVGSNRVSIEFSIYRPFDDSEAQQVSRVVAIEVSEAVSVVNIDVINTICNPIQQPVRILLNLNPSSRHVSGLIEFKDPEIARQVRLTLHGNDIYTGCCNVTAQMSNLPTIPVGPNDSLNWDSEAGVNGAFRAGKIKPGLMDNIAYSNQNVFSNLSSNNNMSSPSVIPVNNSPQVSPFFPPSANMMSNSDPNFGTLGFSPMSGCVLFLNNLDISKFNCDGVFNLVCPYGNVARIKMLVSREGVGLVQMGNATQASNVMRCLNGLQCFGKIIKTSSCNHMDIPIPQTIIKLGDGTPCIKDYMGSLNNRYRDLNSMRRNKVVPPNKTLLFFNTPIDFNVEKLKILLQERGFPIPARMTMFPGKDTHKTTMGLVEYESTIEAVEAMVVMNNIEIKYDGLDHPYHIKFNFSSKPINETKLKSSAFDEKFEAIYETDDADNSLVA